MRHINIELPEIVTAGTEGYVHTQTSWQVSKSYDFSNTDKFIIDIPESTEHKNKLSFDYDFPRDSVLYFRTNIHYENGESEGWTRAITISKNHEGFKFSSTIIVSPDVYVEEGQYDVDIGGFIIKCSPFTLFAGKGTHKYTSWEICNTAGEVVWERPYDSNNLLSIKVPNDILDRNKTYEVKAQHHSDTNSNSNYGKTTICTDIYPMDKIFGFVNNPVNLIKGRYSYFEIKANIENFLKLEYRLLDENYNVVMSGIEERKTFEIDGTANQLKVDVLYNLVIDIFDNLGKRHQLQDYLNCVSDLGTGCVTKKFENRLISMEDTQTEEFGRMFNTIGFPKGDFIGFNNNETLELWGIGNTGLINEKVFVNYMLDNVVSGSKVFSKFINDTKLVIKYTVIDPVTNKLKNSIDILKYNYETKILTLENTQVMSDEEVFSDYNSNFSVIDSRTICYITPIISGTRKIRKYDIELFSYTDIELTNLNVSSTPNIINTCNGHSLVLVDSNESWVFNHNNLAFNKTITMGLENIDFSKGYVFANKSQETVLFVFNTDGELVIYKLGFSMMWELQYVVNAISTLPKVVENYDGTLLILGQDKTFPEKLRVYKYN